MFTKQAEYHYKDDSRLIFDNFWVRKIFNILHTAEFYYKGSFRLILLLI